MDGLISFPVYVLVKYLAYSAWCYFGLRWLRERKSIASGLGFGSVRLGLGILFGAGIFLVGGSLHLNSPTHPWLMYGPVRGMVDHGGLARCHRGSGIQNR
jgi:hypothetical protein